MKSPQFIGPQPGKQTEFMACSADVVCFGGAAGGGKTMGLLMDAMRHYKVPGYHALILRRVTPQILNQGALWDTSEQIYPLVGGRGSKHNLLWRFPSGATVKFGHLEETSTVYDHQGTQISYLGLDEATHFEAFQFWYMLSRLRNMCAVSPVARLTTNPAPGWVAKLVEWYVDQNTGLAIPERSGVIRWFARDGDDIHWSDTAAELKAKLGPDTEPKSFSFISSTVTDNPLLMKNNPGYIANLKALPKVERERLLAGNWVISPAAGLFFKRAWMEVVAAAPVEGSVCRYWDRAGSVTEKSDFTVGLKLRRHPRGVYYVEHVERFKGSPLTVEQAILRTASVDGPNVPIYLEQDPGQAGKADVGNLIRVLAGYNARAVTVTKDKETRAKAVSAQAEAGNVKLVRSPWNESFLNELEAFPEGEHDDQVDALSGAFNQLNGVGKVFFAI